MEQEKFCWLAEAGRLRRAVAAANSLWQRFASVNCVQPRHGEILGSFVQNAIFVSLREPGIIRWRKRTSEMRIFRSQRRKRPYPIRGPPRWQLLHKHLAQFPQNTRP